MKNQYALLFCNVSERCIPDSYNVWGPFDSVAECRDFAEAYCKEWGLTIDEDQTWLEEHEGGWILTDDSHFVAQIINKEI